MAVVSPRRFWMSITTHLGSISRTIMRPKRRLWVVLALFCVGYVVGWVYHFSVWISQTPAAPATAWAYNVAILVTYALLYVYLAYRITYDQKDPARVFWSLLLFSVFVFVIAGALAWASRAASPDVLIEADIRGFELETGVPLTLATVIKMNVVVLLEAGFAFMLLIFLRALVQFKRTRGSMRNWALMIGFMTFWSMLSFMRSPQEDLSFLQAVVLVPTIALMVINSFRLSWVAYLAFREKMAIIGLATLMLAILSIGMATGGDEGFLPRAGVYLQHYSYPIGSFTLLVKIFAILYCVTALLSLIFHLPTTSDFQRKAGEMAAMHSLTTLVGQVFEPERLFSSIASSPVEAGTAQKTWLALRDVRKGSLKPEIVATCDVEADDVRQYVDLNAIFDEVHSKRAPLVLEEAATDHRVMRTDDGIGSMLVVPLLSRDVCHGALFAVRDVAHGFEKDDIEALGVFASQAALAMDNARLFEEVVEKERMSRELTIAREVQQRLLPQSLPQMDGLSLSASYVAAHEVGGDYYDYMQIDDHRLALIVADVSGKGTSAAFYMAELQGIFHSVAPLTDTPAEFLAHANRALSRSLERRVFVSVVYAIIDTRSERVSMARAGHCPAGFVRLDGSARLVRTPGLGLGLDRSDRFRSSLAEEFIPLQPGDALILYTDGVIESRNRDGEEYGYERLLAAMRKHRHEDVDKLNARLLDDLQKFLGHDHYDDDMTMLVLKWHGVGVGVGRNDSSSDSTTRTAVEEVSSAHAKHD